MIDFDTDVRHGQADSTATTAQSALPCSDTCNVANKPVCGVAKMPRRKPPEILTDKLSGRSSHAKPHETKAFSAGKKSGAV